ncbi:PREDICTED: nuclear GTPase SLIP-GC-like [Cyprinodon variegatus]|uniref:nuclear GTPase SLIP-GC-like n=1 Tax=Cyprinodon variegatus TaxID=28743 RepID=UPI0007429D6E|nr:PREDICTED: nuclear GTPase SLIP-GC-like [Cyprinodon variegatus]
MTCVHPQTLQSTSDTNLSILFNVKNIMADVHAKLPNQKDAKVNNFLKTKIMNLDTEKRELVGVFGKTGAGKTSLINAIIEEERLLPSGSFGACTSVMIKVEANRLNHKYEAEVEFLTKEEWKEELSNRDQFPKDNEDQEKDEEYHDLVEKLSAIYGEDWKWKTTDQLMEHKYFREIPEFRHSIRKTFTCESAEALSAKMIKYTRSDTKQEGDEVLNRWYWPLVKCVTVRVPHTNFLQHVTLVDLPGNGDRNKSRDEMWKGIVRNCSTVWIVSNIERATSESESWEILKSASSLLGNGGECRHIHFICTKSDVIEDSNDKVEKTKMLVKNLRETSANKRKSGRGFHNQLKKLVKNKGILKPKHGREKNLNTELISLLTDSIDEEFRKTFPNDGKCGPIYGVIKEVSLDVEGLKQKYSDVELQLVFLKNEEEQLKTKLTKLIRDHKKKIYNSPAKTAEENLKKCYEEAAGFSGTGLLQNMRETIERHVHKSKNILFEKAKDEMLDLHSSMAVCYI